MLSARYSLIIRIITVLFAALFLCMSGPVFAEDEPFDESEIDAPYYIVLDANDIETVFFEREADTKCLPASTTKIMTCVLVLENCENFDERITVTKAAAYMKDSNSLMHVIAGETLSVTELLYGLMLESGNDAAKLLAERFGGSIEGFADMMNAKAKEIGMSDTTVFVNASGAYKAGGKIGSTARDMAKLTAYAMQNEKFREIVSTVRYTVPTNEVRKKPLELVNTNRLISDEPNGKRSVYYSECIGVKTGSTEQGGKCLVSAAERDGATVICVMFGLKEGGSKNKRMERVFADSAMLLKEALDSYESFDPTSFNLNLPTEAPYGTNGSTVVTVPDFSEFRLNLSKQRADALRQDPSKLTVDRMIEPISEDVTVGDTVGTLTASLNGEVLFSVPIVVTAVNVVITPVPTATPSPAPTAEQTVETPEPDQSVTIHLPISLIAILAVAVIAFIGAVIGIILHRKRR